MLQQYKTKTNLFVGLGLALNVLAGWVLPGRVGPGIILVLAVAGSVLFITGCCFYAKGKEYHAAWGLLGLLSIIGLLVFICMRDKHKA